MGGFDWIIAGIFLLSILVGIMRGFIKESLSIVSWIAAVWLAITFCSQAGDVLGQFIDIPNQKFREWGGFAVIFMSTLFVFAIVRHLIVKLFVRGAIKGTDRVLGIGFGALRAGFIVVVFIIIIRGLGVTENGFWADSQLLPYFELPATYVESMLPDDWQTEPSESDPQEEDGVLKGKLIDGLIENLPVDAG